MLFDPNNEKDKLLYLLEKITGYAEQSNKNKYNMNTVNYALTLKCLL